MADKSTLEKPTHDNKIPVWIFGYSALASFIVGIFGMGADLYNDESQYFFLYFLFSFFLAPALLIYPVLRYVLGEGKTGIAAFLSALFGYYIQANIKKSIQKKNK